MTKPTVSPERVEQAAPKAHIVQGLGTKQFLHWLPHFQLSGVLAH